MSFSAFIPLGDSLLGPSINVGGERKALVSDAGRPSGDGPYGDFSTGGHWELSQCKQEKICTFF